MPAKNPTEYMRKYRVKNRQRIRDTNNRHYHKCKVKILKQISITGKIYRQNNKDKIRIKNAYHNITRETRKINATPTWLDEFQKFQMKLIYTCRAHISDRTKTVWEVDHIIPLKGKNICGLHVPWNLRVIPRLENQSKGNRY